MADDKYRAYRSRDPIADIDPVPRGASDPLAELARLIGQSDPVGASGRSTRQSPAEMLGDAPDPVADPGWAADEGYAEPDQYAESREQRARFADSDPDPRAYAPHEDDYDQQPSEAAQYSRQAGDFDHSGDDAMGYDPRYPDEIRPIGSGRQLPVLAPRSPDAGYEASEQWHDGADDQSYVAEAYDDEVPTAVRRSGVVVAVAILGLVTLGVAGAFAYRTMFGGSVLPSLPPIIKASNGPNKIIPTHSDSQADAANQAGATDSTGEKLVSREEQPLNIQTPPNTSPRVISTIPVLPGPGGAAQGAPPVVVLTPAAPAAPPPGATAPSLPPAAAPLITSAPPPVAGATAPKKIHTVIIRSDQSGGTAEVTTPAAPPTNLAPGASAAAPAPPARSAASRPAGASAPRPTTSPTRQQANVNAPLAIVPQQDEASPPETSPPTRVVRAEPSNAPLPLGPATSAAPSPSSGGGYAVQLTSQRSQEEAQAAFRSLQAKFPNQLAGHQPIIRRADLGDKGTFYRALVGPFASAEQAAAMCSNLKSAGGTCIVQRN
jgi:hypothetical protein